MVAMYCLIGIVLALPVIPIYYAKCVSNSLYIAGNKQRVDYRCQHVFKVMFTILLNPFLILLSLLLDLITLPSVLLKDEKKFNYKYQQTVDVMTQD